MRSGLDSADSEQAEPAEPEVIVIREPVVLDGPQASGAHYSQRARASSCYVNRSCPTCAPCCLALFLAPLLYVGWNILPTLRESREIERFQRIRAEQESSSIPDPASDRLLTEVRSMQFSSRPELEAFIEQRGIAFEKREDGYWIAADRTQQAALVVLQQRWLELPEAADDIPHADDGLQGD
ncbi:MAG: hypothetical protein R3F46_06445 [bacterium]